MLHLRARFSGACPVSIQCRDVRLHRAAGARLTHPSFSLLAVFALLVWLAHHVVPAPTCPLCPKEDRAASRGVPSLYLVCVIRCRLCVPLPGEPNTLLDSAPGLQQALKH